MLSSARRPRADLVAAMTTPDPRLDALREDADRAAFQVGGVDRTLTPEQQLDQLASYIHAHYEAPAKNPPWHPEPSDPLPADTFDARLPDRLTHSAMLMLGSGLDHSMPGVAFPGDVTATDHHVDGTAIQVFTPSQPVAGRVAITLHPGGWWKGAGVALENAWRPEVAGAAERSGVTLIDIDYPLLPAATLPEVIASVEKVAAWARHEYQPTVLAAWGYSSGGALAVLCKDNFDALALTFPHLDLDWLPKNLRVGVDTFPPATTWPATFLQVATHDAIAQRIPAVEASPSVTVREYVSEHRVSTPEVARQRVLDVAEFLAKVDPL